MSDFKGFIKQPENYDEWKEQTNSHPEVKEHGDKIVKESNYNFLKFFSVLSLIIFIIFLSVIGYLVYDGKFQSIITTTLSPNFSPNVSVSNQYDMPSPVVNNYYTQNTTILNKIYLNSSNG